jgi:hypothetical protein
MRTSGGQLRRKEWDKNPRPIRGRVHLRHTKVKMFCSTHQALQSVTDAVAGEFTLACGCRRSAAA